MRSSAFHAGVLLLSEPLSDNLRVEISSANFSSLRLPLRPHKLHWPRHDQMQKPVVAGWNKPTHEYYDVPKARQRKSLSRSKLYGACVLMLAVLFGWQGYVIQAPALKPFVCLAISQHEVDVGPPCRVSQSRWIFNLLAISTVRGRN